LRLYSAILSIKSWPMENVSYIRVSTPQQGISGLGLAAQKEIVQRFLGNTLPIAEFVEVETGRQHKNRPQLQAALELCKKRKARLVIAKLDRLARNVAFISALMESGVDFVCCDNPHATRLMLHLLAAFAEHEHDVISERIKAAMGAIKADLAANGSRVSRTGRRYTRLGSPSIEQARLKAWKARRARTPSEHALDFMRDLRASGTSFRRIAEEMNRWQLHTGHGNPWYASTVRTALSRMPGFQKDRFPGSSKGRNPESGISCQRSSSALNGSNSDAMPSFIAPIAGRRAKKEGEITMADLAEAYRMLDTFASAGATHFDVTFTDIDGQKTGFHADQTARQLRNSLPKLFPGLTERQRNLIVRPRGDKVMFVQLDDLDSEKIKPLAAVSCLIIETSPGNHQAWVALQEMQEHAKPAGHAGGAGLPFDAKDFARRLRKGTGADAAASGATRMAGTVNYKRKYEPEFPEVNILQAAPGRVVTKAQLESLGLVSAPEPIHVAAATPFRVSSVGRSWPDYERCVLGAPPNHDKSGPDISRADYFFAMLSAQRGHSIEEIAARLMDLSSKAKENGERYARLTAENATAATERQRLSRA